MTLLRDDHQLRAAFRRGDPAALDRVYRFYSADVARYLARAFVRRADGSTRSAPLAPLDLDAAHQEAFIRAFADRARTAYDGLRPYRGFLLAIARSAAVDLLRSGGKLGREWVPLDDSGVPIEPSSDARTPEEESLAAEARAVVRSFLGGLSEQDRQLAGHRFVDDQSQVEAARALGLSRQELRTREQRLRKALVQHLEQTGWLDAQPQASRATLLMCLLALFSLWGGVP